MQELYMKTLVVLLVVTSALFADSPRISTLLSAHFDQEFASHASKTSFNMGIAADIHGSADAWNSNFPMWEDSSCIAATCVGDIGYGRASDITNMNAAAAAHPTVKLFPVLGNHELDNFGKVDWIDALAPAVVPLDAWEQNDGNTDRVYYSYNIGANCRVYVFDAYADDASGSCTIDTAQLKWFFDDLGANPDRHALVFCHAPLHFPSYGSYHVRTRSFVLGALGDHVRNNNKQAWVFSGHIHAGSAPVMLDDVKLVRCTQSMTGILNVDGDNIKYTEYNNVSSGAPRQQIFIDLDESVAYKPVVEGGLNVLRIADDSTFGIYGKGGTGTYITGDTVPTVTAENGVTPVHGTKMIGVNVSGWTKLWISNQYVRIVPGMKYSYQIYHYGSGLDSISVMPCIIPGNFASDADLCSGDGICAAPSLSIFNTAMHGHYDVPGLKGRAEGKWYKVEFDLSDYANTPRPSYLQTWRVFPHRYIGSSGIWYIDDIKVTWPAGTTAEGLFGPEHISRVDLKVQPNPFSTSVDIFVRHPSHVARHDVRLGVFNIAGKMITNIKSRATPVPHYDAGNDERRVTSYTWTAHDKPPGVYMVKLQAGPHRVTRKIFKIQ
jgi:hypothetical protein